MANEKGPDEFDQEVQRFFEQQEDLNPDKKGPNAYHESLVDDFAKELAGLDNPAAKFMELETQELEFAPLPADLDHTGVYFESDKTDAYIRGLHGKEHLTQENLVTVAETELADLADQEQLYDIEHPGFLRQRQILHKVKKYFADNTKTNDVWFSTMPLLEEGVEVTVYGTPQENMGKITREWVEANYTAYAQPFEHAREQITQVRNALSSGSRTDTDTREHILDYVGKWQTRFGLREQAAAGHEGHTAAEDARKSEGVFEQFRKQVHSMPVR